MSYVADEDVYQRCEKHNYVLSCSFIHSLPWNMPLHCFLTVNSLVNTAGDHLAGGSFMEKAL